VASGPGQAQSPEAGAEVAAALESALSSLADKKSDYDDTERASSGRGLISFIGSTDDLDDIGARVRSIFTDEITMEPLAEAEAQEYLRHAAQNVDPVRVHMANGLEDSAVALGSEARGDFHLLQIGTKSETANIL